MISPVSLTPGNKISIVAPARKVTPQELSNGIQFLEQSGLEIELGKHLYQQHHQYAGTDLQRLSDFQQALDNPNTKAIICARGGYGTSRIIDQLDFSQFLRNPKWICGFSDNTTLHCHLHQLGIQSIHSTVPLLMGKESTLNSDNSLVNALFGQPLPLIQKAHDLNIQGETKAEIIGGNLSLVVNMLGTASAPDFKNKILFLEDVDEHLYYIDRLMVQLKRTGILEQLSGLLVGHFSKIKDAPSYFGKNVSEIIHEHTSEYNYPVGFNIPSGHEDENMAIVFGRTCLLKINSQGTSVTYC